MGGFRMGLFNGGFNGLSLILVLFVLLTIVGADD
ncbi:YjcZ family sporulation protein [Brevibacillus parabrevis]